MNLEEDYERGSKKTRGTQRRNDGRIAEHSYRDEHMNRDIDEDRGARRPKRRYDD